MEKFQNYIFHPDEEIDLRLYNIGEERCNPGYLFGPAIRSHYMFHYIISGKGTYYASVDNSETARITATVSAGEGFLIIPGMQHSYMADHEEPWHYLWIEFDGIKAQKFLKSAGLSRKSMIYKPNDYNINTFSSLHRPLNIIVSNPHESMTFFLGHLYLFFDSLIKQSKNTRLSNSLTEIRQIYMEQACKYIDDNYPIINSIEDLADQCKISQSYLNKIFKEYLNMTPQKYLTDYRMAKASQLLTTTSLTISQITYSIGYKNRQSFTRRFKEKYNVTPSDFRYLNYDN